MTIKKLSEREKCRSKVAVWFGSKSNYLHPVREAVANAFDEVYNNRKRGYITVKLEKDGRTITITDNGRGIPIHKETEGVPNYELLFETLFAGTKYDNDEEFTTGTNGCGMTVTQYCSDYFYVGSRIDGVEYFVEYQNGESLVDYDLKGTKDFNGYDGTTVSFRLSEEVFDRVIFNAEDIKDLCYRTALVSNGHTSVSFYDVKTEQEYVFEFNSISEGLNDDTFMFLEKNYTEENGDKHRIECAISNKVEDELIQDVYLNATHLVEGGTIHDGIYEAVRRYINKYLESNGLYKAKEKKITKDDVKDSIQFICNYFATRIEFANQTKFATKSKMYREIIIDYILENLEILKNENPHELEKMAKNILVNKRATEKSKESFDKIKKQLQGKLTIDNRVDGFVDCREHGEQSEIYIAEGRSALGSIVLARNSDYQAVYPIRGKLLNILKTDFNTALANKEIEAFIKILGCGVEEKIKGTPLFNKDDLRFGKIVIATDQDTDGLHIQCLVLTAIYRLLPTLIKEGHVYILNTPLFEVKDLENDKVYYAYNEAQRNEIVSKLKKYQINRNKGLGELEPETMSSCINPESKTKVQVTWEDAEKIAHWFDVLMGDNAKERKDFVEQTLPDYIMNVDNDTEVEDIAESRGIISILQNNIKEYAGYIITDRVLPSVEDGLKPSQLRILWTMYKKKAFNLTKSGNITGEVFKYHPHGNTYPTLVKMTQTDRQNVPYIVGKGNFGQHTSSGLKEAAERYTECKLSDLATEMLEGTKGNAVDFVYNFDKTELMPKYLATKFPSVLGFVNTGIALGMASAIPSYNIEELCNATIKYLQEGKKELIYPDFATGGYIIKDDRMFKDICETGRGSVRIRGKAEIVKNSIIITEIPHSTTREAIIEKVISLTKSNKLPEVASVKDLTDLKGLKVEIICKRGVDKDILLEKLYKLTPLEDSFSVNMNVLVNGVPKLLGVYDIIKEWSNFRMKSIKGNLANEINKQEKELHMLRGLKDVLLDVDLVVDIIRKTPKDKINEKMNEKFGLDVEQSKFVCSMQLININEDYIKNKIKDIDQKEKALEKLKETLNSEDKIKNIMVQELKDTIKKHGVKRKTQLLTNVKEIKIESPVVVAEDYNVKVIFTKEGYLKKVRLTSAKGENKLKENDSVILEVDTTNTDEIVILCDDMNAHKFKLDEIEDVKMNSFGTFMPNITKAKPLGAFVISDNKFVFITYKERFAKIDIAQYVTKTRRSKLKNSLYSKDVVSVLALKEDVEISYTTSKGKVRKVNTSDFMMKQTRDTQGTKISIKDTIKSVEM